MDGVWSAWSNWTECSTTCGGGLSFRNRTCVGRLFNGAPCNGSFADMMPCNEFNCPGYYEHSIFCIAWLACTEFYYKCLHDVCLTNLRSIKCGIEWIATDIIFKLLCTCLQQS